MQTLCIKFRKFQSFFLNVFLKTVFRISIVGCGRNGRLDTDGCVVKASVFRIPWAVNRIAAYDPALLFLCDMTVPVQHAHFPQMAECKI